MFARVHVPFVALMLLAVVLWLVSGSAVVLVVLVTVAIGVRLLPVAARSPERAALILAVIAVASGAIGAGVHVADGIADSRIEYHGELDTGEILSSFHPSGPYGSDDPVPGFERRGDAYLSDAKGVATVPRADGDQLVLWSVAELAPWLLAAIALALLAPILRAAERGDPFRSDATRRLAVIGTLLLAGIPALALLRYILAQSVTEGVLPMVEPTLTLSVLQFLPGVLVLVLAGVFRRGAELRDLERHTI
ncbi:MAG: DUF2975 domain-containing protein [Actinomycetota bacterium]|nr:DUF2975 domain-containing protein [Actinomycetota bacterium]